MTRIAQSAAALLLLALACAPAAAQPPADALPLSEVLRGIEAEADFGYFEEVEWDDDHWEIEYRRTDGGSVEIDVDPRTGAPR